MLKVIFWARTSRLWKPAGAGAPKAEPTSPFPREQWTPCLRKTRCNILIIAVDAFLLTSLELSRRPCLTGWECDTSRNCFGPCEMPAVSRVSCAHPRPGVAHCWFIWRRPRGWALIQETVGERSHSPPPKIIHRHGEHFKFCQRLCREPCPGQLVCGAFCRHSMVV